MKGVTQRDDNQTTVSVSNAENSSCFLEQKEKFKKEARRLRKLKSEHIVAVHDMFDENNTAYYAMDYIDGENLAERLKRTGRPLTESELRLILPQILDALKTVHQEGFCHLDLKPSNIMLEKGGRVKLIDFGSSKQMSNDGSLTTNAPTAFTHTPGFAPRELIERNAKNIGPWTDIYALGATLYNLLTSKKPPLPSDIDDDMSADKHEALPFPSNVSDSMKSLVLQMINTNRMQRPQSIDAIVIPDLSQQNSVSGNQNTERNHRIDSPWSKDDQEEETIIAEPKPKREEKKPEPKPEPKVYTQPTQSSYTSASHVSNDSDSSGKGYLIGILVFVIVIVLILANNGGCGNREQKGNQQSVENVEPQIVESMSWESPLGSCQYTGPVDNNIPHGRGKASFDDGRYYEGIFSHGTMQGIHAYFQYPNGDVFKGEFRNNSFYYGVYTIAEDGSSFHGYYKNGQPSEGKWYDKNGKVTETIKK